MLVMGNELCVTRRILFNGSFGAIKTKLMSGGQGREGQQPTWLTA